MSTPIQQVINVGSAPNDGQGDPLRTAFIKTNNNVANLFAYFQTSVPVTLVGSPGDFAGMVASDSNYYYYCFENYDGSTVIWAQLSQIGNIGISAINNGTSNVKIGSANANVAVTVAGISNVAVFNTAGLNITGNANISIDVNAAGLKSSGQISAVGDVIGGNLTTGGNAQVTGNLTAGNIGVATLLSATGSVYGSVVDAVVHTGTSVSVTGNITSGNVNTVLLSASGNVTGNNITTNNIVSAVGNIVTDSYFVGTFFGNVTGNFVVSGSNTQVLFNTSGNVDAVPGLTYKKDSNVLTVLGNVSAQGNVIAGNVTTSGLISATSDITGGNILTSGLISATGNITGGNINTVAYTGSTISVTANITGGNVLTNGIISSSSNVIGGNILTSGVMSATGNISTTGNVTVGSNVSATNYTGTSLSVTANVTAGNLNTSGKISATSNITGGNILTSGLVSASGNIQGSYLLGNGFYITGYVPTVSNINNGSSNVSAIYDGNITVGVSGLSNVVVIATGSVDVAGVISATGNITGENLKTGNIVSATGNVIGGNLLTSGLISASGNILAANINLDKGTASLGNIVNNNSNGIGNIGSTSSYFNTVFAKSTSAQYADLAEMYLSDANYEYGTVVSFGGEFEVTISDIPYDTKVAGIVSKDPAFRMNTGLQGKNTVALALIGRVPCKIIGPVEKGDLMVSAGNGMARSCSTPQIGTVIGKSLENFAGVTGVIEVAVGKL